MGRATFCTDRQDVRIHDCASQLVIFILSCANGWGNTQAFSINIAVQFPLSPIHAVFRSPYADPYWGVCISEPAAISKPYPRKNLVVTGSSSGSGPKLSFPTDLRYGESGLLALWIYDFLLVEHYELNLWFLISGALWIYDFAHPPRHWRRLMICGRITALEKAYDFEGSPQPRVATFWYIPKTNKKTWLSSF